MRLAFRFILSDEIREGYKVAFTEFEKLPLNTPQHVVDIMILKMYFNLHTMRTVIRFDHDNYYPALLSGNNSITLTTNLYSPYILKMSHIVKGKPITEHRYPLKLDHITIT